MKAKWGIIQWTFSVWSSRNTLLTFRGIVDGNVEMFFLSSPSLSCRCISFLLLLLARFSCSPNQEEDEIWVFFCTFSSSHPLSLSEYVQKKTIFLCTKRKLSTHSVPQQNNKVSVDGTPASDVCVSRAEQTSTMKWGACCKELQPSVFYWTSVPASPETHLWHWKNPSKWKWVNQWKLKTKFSSLLSPSKHWISTT